jgi:CRISPR-associated protein Csb1
MLHAAAQFNSVWKALNQPEKEELEKAAKVKKKVDDEETKLSKIGFADAPAVFRPKLKVPKFLHGMPNPEARVLGGVFVRDRIEREVTVNLVALRNIRAKEGETEKIQKYLLGLALLAATREIDLFLREGCHLRYATTDDEWRAIPRRGTTNKVNLGSKAVQATILRFTIEAAKAFLESEDAQKNAWPPKSSDYSFDLAEAKKLLAKKDEDSTEQA